ncbi:heterokaryon incompatibility protein-domain-containing protein [Podospora fimiseda]|uniref:Heterokaryon incompatibility protein-domain-containing protein n=1 Tax=Podospora fimiseda TaxID=252190 RepID=A0AAN7BL62_9PEZI|nr:heterokaryon incompatibility protein-domain-containing protein [Podospora fimiseda]
MRLINVHTLKLHEFFGSNIPTGEYAILSHTWEEEEVTFQEMQSLGDNPDIRTKKGFSKIESTCKKAKENGIKWAWVDTCCIDKSSSAELSEAINSMFAWYKRSKICYAYLVDVEDDEDGEAQKSNFEKSRWFTRGWTLQELLAPTAVQFFSKSWNYLGTRGSLKIFIETITGIPANILAPIDIAGRSEEGDDCDIPRAHTILAQYSVAQRMSWASNRQTTREEDMAYCLLGIFDIHMPLLYGERSKAFSRLQEEIIKQIDDHSIFAWAVNSKDPAAWSVGPVLARSPADFADCSNIRVRHEEVGEPSVLTKKGLHIHAPVIPHSLPDTTRFHNYGMDSAYTRRGMHPQLFQLVLNCQSNFREDYIVIWILRTDEWSIEALDGGVFLRVMAPGVQTFAGTKHWRVEFNKLAADFSPIYLRTKPPSDSSQPFIGGGFHFHGVPLVFTDTLLSNFTEPLWSRGWCLISSDVTYLGANLGNARWRPSSSSFRDDRQHRRLTSRQFATFVPTPSPGISITHDGWVEELAQQSIIYDLELIGDPSWRHRLSFLCGTVSTPKGKSDSGLICWLKRKELMDSPSPKPSWAQGPPVIYPNGHTGELALLEAKYGKTIIEVMIYRQPTTYDRGIGLASESAQTTPHILFIFSSYSTDSSKRRSMLDDYKSLGRLSTSNRDANWSLSEESLGIRLNPISHSENEVDKIKRDFVGDTTGHGVMFAIEDMLDERRRIMMERENKRRERKSKSSKEDKKDIRQRDDVLEWCRLHVFNYFPNGRKMPKLRYEQRY